MEFDNSFEVPLPPEQAWPVLMDIRGIAPCMIFGAAHLVWACSQYFILEPGDVIITGTPPGVGLGMRLPMNW